MLVTWRYRERNTLIQRLDPRARIIFMLSAFFSLFQFWNSRYFWDLRYVLFFFVLAMSQLFLARLSWRETRRFWLVICFIVVILSLATALTGRGGVNIYSESHPYPLWQAEFQVLGAAFKLVISVERFTFLVVQIIRFITFAALAVPIPFTIHPARYGITFRRLGLPDKFSFAIDLAFRFVPSLGKDFQMTLDAQRARGYELERIGGGLVQQIRNMAPLLIPLIVGSIVRSEEIIDAMDLRGFGTRKRTWLEELRFAGLDYGVILFSLALFLGSTVLSLLGYGDFWVPPFLLNLATG